MANRCHKCYPVLILCGLTSPGLAERPTFDLANRLQARESMQRGTDFLAASQRLDGAWEAFGRPHPAITALAVKAMCQDARFGSEHSAVKRGLAFVLKFVQPDGGIYVPDEGMRNYHTSVALLALSAMKPSTHNHTIAHAQKFLSKLQWDSGEGHEQSSPFYGGQGYGPNKRPDLSNTQLMLEALHQSGLSPDHPTYQKAIVFVSRCQMLDRSNDQPLADGSDDGGFVYTPANGGESKAGTVMAGDRPRLRSYGSMTYAGFKSLLYAQVDRNDPRIQNAFAWLQKHYTLDRNPNMPNAESKQGLYYFFHIFARALYAWGDDVIPDATGTPHNWRSDLVHKLASLQQKDGSWVNAEDRWFEGNPHLVTAYSVLALQTVLASPPGQ